QFQEGHDLLELVDTSDVITEGDAEAEGQATGAMQTHTWNEVDGRSQSEMFRQAVREAQTKADSHQAGRGGATGTNKQDTKSHTRSKSHARGTTRKQQLVPIIKTKDIITSVAFFTKEELEAVSAALLANLPIGQAVLHVSGTMPGRVAFPLAEDP